MRKTKEYLGKNVDANVCFMIAFALLVIFALTVIIVAAVSFDTDIPRLVNYEMQDFSDGWTDEGGNIALLGEKSKASSVTIKKTLSKFDEDKIIALDLEACNIRASVDGVEVLESGFSDKRPFGTSSGRVRYIIPLSTDNSDTAGTSEIVIYIERKDGALFTLPKLIIADKSDYMFGSFLKALPQFVFFIIGIVFMIMLFVSTIYNYATKAQTASWHSYLYLSIFMFFAAWWIFTSSGIIQFLNMDRTTAYFSNMYSLMLMPIPLLLFLKNFCPNTKTVYNVLAPLTMLNMVICTILHISNAVDISASLVSTHAVILVDVFFALLCCGLEIFKYKRKEINAVITGIAVALLSAAFALLDFYTLHLGIYPYVVIVGMSAFIIQFTYLAYKKQISVFKIGMKSEKYRKLAYIDKMSGLENRTAYDEAMEQLEGEIKILDYVGFIVFDINGLKRINDEFGHSEGDLIIKAAARIIANMTERVGESFRTGGDEFVTIIRNKTYDDVMGFKAEFEERIQCENKFLTHKLGIALGLVIEKIDTAAPLNIYKLWNAADDRMYENKKSMEFIFGEVVSVTGKGAKFAGKFEKIGKKSALKND